MSGRPSAATEKALKAILDGKLNPFAAAKKFGLSPSTIYRALAKIPVSMEEAMPREAARARRLNAEGMRYARRKA